MAVQINVVGTYDGKQIERAQKQLAKLGDQTKQLDNGFKVFGKQVDSLSNGFKSMAQKATIAFAAVSYGFMKATGAASDLAEETSKARVIFGSAADEVLKFAETAAQSFGLSEKSAISAASTFAIFGKSAGLSGKELTGFSLNLVKLSADFASFFNTTPEDAIQAIGAALRGESEPIRRYGILLNDATLKQRALAMGLYDGTGALDMQAKVLAAQAEILAQSSDAQGDFERTATGLANSQRILKAETDNAVASIGEALLPILMEVMPLVTDLAQFIGRNSDVFAALAVNIGVATAALVLFNTALAANPIVLIATAVAALGVAVVTMYQKWEAFRSVVNVVGNFVISAVEMMINSWVFFINLIVDSINTVSGPFRWFAKQIGITIGEVGKLSDVSLPRLGDTAKKTGKDIVTSAADFRIMDQKLGGTKKSLDDVTTSAGGTAKTIKEKLKPAVEKAIELFRDKMKDALDVANKKLDEAQTKYDDFYKTVYGSIAGNLDFAKALNTAEGNTSKLTSAIEEQTSAHQEYERATRDVATAQANVLSATTLNEYFNALDNVTSASDNAQTALNRLEAANEAVAGAKSQPLTFIESLRDQATEAQNFGTKIQKLIDAGLTDPSVIQQIADAGAETGGKIADSILAGGAEQIKEIQGLITSVNTVAQKVATLTAGKWYQAGVDSATEYVKGVTAAITEAEKKLPKATTIADVKGIEAGFDAAVAALPPIIEPGKEAPVPTKAADPFAAFQDQAIDWYKVAYGLSGIRMFADGGIVTKPTLGMVGEAGPEAIIPLNRMGSGGNVYNITIQAGIGDPIEIGRQVKTVLQDYDNRAGSLIVQGGKKKGSK